MKKAVLIFSVLCFTWLTGQAGAEQLTASAANTTADQTKTAPVLIDMVRYINNDIHGEDMRDHTTPATNGIGTASVHETTTVPSPLKRNVPEPAAMLLLGIGLTAMASFGKRLFKK